MHTVHVFGVRYISQQTRCSLTLKSATHEDCNPAVHTHIVWFYSAIHRLYILSQWTTVVVPIYITVHQTMHKQAALYVALPRNEPVRVSLRATRATH